MTALLLLSLLQPEPVEGTAAFSYRIESAAEVRGMDLHGWGSAVLDCDRIGQTAWVQVGGAWYETTVVDCTAAQHRELWRDWGRVVDLPWALWEQAGLPLMPVPASVQWIAPGPCPGMVKAEELCSRMEGGGIRMINGPENAGLPNAARIALAMYEGEPCRICGKPITNAADAVFVGYSADNKARAAHEECALGITETVERQRQAIASLDFPIRRAIAFIQAFISHHKYPDMFGVPDLDDAATAWRDLNDVNVRAFKE